MNLFLCTMWKNVFCCYDCYCSEGMIYSKNNTLVVSQASNESPPITAEFHSFFIVLKYHARPFFFVGKSFHLFHGVWCTIYISQLLRIKIIQLSVILLSNIKCTSQSRY